MLTREYPLEGDPTPGEWEHREIDGVVHAKPLNNRGGSYPDLLWRPVTNLRGRVFYLYSETHATSPYAPSIPLGESEQPDNAMEEQSKPSNPKDVAAVTRPVPAVPLQPLLDQTLKHFEGMLKYGANNWTIVGVRSSVYVGAALRHIFKWWCGEEYELVPLEDEAGKQTGEYVQGVHHIGGALASLAIVRDAQARNKLTDDRPPELKGQGAMWDAAAETMKNLVRAFGHKKPKHYTIADSERQPR